MAWMKESWLALNRWERTALGLWATLVIFVSVRVLIFPFKNTVYPIFSESCGFWWSQFDLYEPFRSAGSWGGFRYSPTFTILATPFSWLSDAIGGVLWRIVQMAFFLAMVGWWARTAVPQSLTRNQLAILFILLLPLSLQSVNNGQVNILVAGCLVGAVTGCLHQRWWLVSLLLTLAFLCKLYPIALGMILLLLYPRALGWRLLLVVAGGLLFPFLFAPPEYVLDQYRKWALNLRADDRSQMNLHSIYRDLWILVRIYDLPLSRSAYQVLQVFLGGLVAFLCLLRKYRGWSEREVLVSTLSLSTGWMMLLGPATESCTFVLMAPSLAWALIQARSQPFNWRHLFLAVTCIGFAMAATASISPQGTTFHSKGIHAWASLSFFLFLLTERRQATTASVSLEGDRTWRLA